MEIVYLIQLRALRLCAPCAPAQAEVARLAPTAIVYAGYREDLNQLEPS
ncbi:MAG: hypothetical protein ACK4P5_07630 [Fimbriimonadales bacterium]